MKRTITKEHATAIAKKLGMEHDPGDRSSHDLYVAYHDGIAVASFGIRRGSKKNQGHGHIPRELGISWRKTLELAWCTRSREEWLDELAAAGNLHGSPD